MAHLIEDARLVEFLATCNFRSAFQSDGREQFEKRMRSAANHYERAAVLFAEKGDSALSKRSEARALFASFWLQREVPASKDLLRKCVETSNQARRVLEETGDRGRLTETLTDLLRYYRHGCNLATESDSLRTEFEEALRVARAIVELEREAEPEDFLEALDMAIWLLAVEAQIVLEPAEFRALEGEARRLEAKLAELSSHLKNFYASSLAKEAAGNIAFDFDGNPARALELYEESLSGARATRDSRLLGWVLWLTSQAALSGGVREDDRELRRKLLSKGLKLASEAIRALEISMATTDLAAAHATCADYHIEFANLVETSAEKKKLHFRSAVEIASRGTTYETGTWAWSQAAHSKAKALYFLSRVEKPEERVQLLREALSVRQQTVHVTDRLLPHFWSPVVMRYYLALVKFELATVENPETRVRNLTDAVTIMRQCMDLGSKWVTNPGFSRRLAQYSETYGDILSEFHTVTKDPAVAQQAIIAYEDAATYFTGSNHLGALATTSWKIARIFDHMGQFEKARDTFKRAVKESRLGAKEIPGSAPTFEELARYMEAWVNIETARIRHGNEEYASAQEDYTKAAVILQSTTTWNSLSRLVKARATLETAEVFSSEEKRARAVEAFKTAIETFQDAKNELENRLLKSEAIEHQELREWSAVASQQETYCRGRIELEEARILDTEGKKASSARKYRSASELFATLVGEMEDAHDRGEVETLVRFCDAWAKMKEAESKALPELYVEAAESFLKVKEIATREQFRLLALANASICRALDFGTRFRLTQAPDLYSKAKKQLEAAADYFREAGYKKTESWTRATQRLFDALVFLSDAEAEREPKKKAELYHLAEKQLELAAKLYGEAGFPHKKEEALTHMGRAREEKQLLLAPIEALSQIPTASGSLLASVTLGSEPLGVERFDEAYVVGEMHTPQRELPVGSGLTYELEIANVGKTPATLVKLQDMVPEGVEFDTQKNVYSREDSFIDLKGKRLDYLKTHQVKVSLRAIHKGVFQLRPRLFYADDRGAYKSYQFPLTTVSVLELGTPVTTPLSMEMALPKIALPAEFRFETERAKEVFQCLVKEFLSDYMSKRIYVEKAGWRSLMDIVRQMKIPRSALYGPEGREGPILIELDRRGLVESRIFPKERGRGGAIKKVRVAYDNAIVKKIVEQTVVENK